jgi:hypothetical protein
MALGGLMRLVQLARDWRSASGRRAWPTARGAITRADLERLSPPDDPESIALYTPQVRFEYTAGDQTYTGQTEDAKRALARESAERIVARYPVGAAVTVRYDPARPQRATLSTGADQRIGRPLLLAGISLLAGAALILGGISGLG